MYHPRPSFQQAVEVPLYLLGVCTTDASLAPLALAPGCLFLCDPPVFHHPDDKKNGQQHRRHL
eukprot:2592902-Prymnesium_polylepis.1